MQAGDRRLPRRQGGEHDHLLEGRPRLLRAHTPLQTGSHVSAANLSDLLLVILESTSNSVGFL